MGCPGTTMKTKNRTSLRFAEGFVEQLVPENVHVAFRWMKIQKVVLKVVAGGLLITFDFANGPYIFTGVKHQFFFN